MDWSEGGFGVRVDHPVNLGRRGHFPEGRKSEKRGEAENGARAGQNLKVPGPFSAKRG